jgi:hypothetical protein
MDITCVRVLPEIVEGLTGFSLTVLDLATGKPRGQVKAVGRTVKPDCSLDHTQGTSTEPNHEALQKMKPEQKHHDRPRRLDASGRLNPGLLLIPHK